MLERRDILSFWRAKGNYFEFRKEGEIISTSRLKMGRTKIARLELTKCISSLPFIVCSVPI